RSKIISILNEIFDNEDRIQVLDDNLKLSEQLDSMEIIELVVLLENKLNIVISDELLSNISQKTLDEFIRIIEQL
ncbi:phosphopantetheine-binding protein, partial [Streptococcus intermedius]|uniref:phosphopantetheine-binding protein n=2 Tax=Streptococcus TaxID=1301 RepID=UPI000F67B901